MINCVDLTPAQVDFLRNSLDDFSVDTWDIEPAGRAASQRYFIRITGAGRSYVLMVWDSRDEDWERFLTIQKELSGRLAFLPEIYKEDKLHGLILEEDLGSMTLKRFCAEKPDNRGEVIAVYKKVLDALCKWQFTEAEASRIISSRKMDEETFLWETGYFARYCVTDYCGREGILDEQWERERVALARESASLPQTFIHRDFQSENIMIIDERVRFVDFQGARLGPPQYDTASLLFDPYVKIIGEAEVLELYGYYSDQFSDSLQLRQFYICAAQRLMQALGAYCSLTLHKGKEWYREYIPIALDRLKLVTKNLPEFPRIRSIADSCSQVLRG